MRVGVSLLTLVPGISGGSETYARGLARGLARVGRHEYVVLVPTIAADAGGGLPTQVVADYRAARTIPGRLRAMALATARPEPLQRRLAGVDGVHFPLTVPIPPIDGPVALTLLDVQHLDLPDLFPRGERLYRRLAYDRAARHADQVVVISEFVRERAIARLGLAPERVHAIPLAVDHARFRPDGGPREPFLLYPARPWRHKNHERLFAALTALRAERPELRLVLTGAGHDPSAAPPGVEVRGTVSGAELANLYRRAACLVFPSLYEGFGLPPLEAMACGCPVASSSAASLPEVCGDAAVLFDPADPDAIAAAVLEALARADELSARGVERARAFTWDATARAHDLVYDVVAAR